jgi:hypothetical protein
MDQKHRQKRLRLLISKLNKERKKQSKKIDIICNDLISAHRDFIKRLNTISFATYFYESIIGITELNKLLFTASNLIKNEIIDASPTIPKGWTGSKPPSAAWTGSPERDGQVQNRPSAGVTFFLRRTDGFKTHSFQGNKPTQRAGQDIPKGMAKPKTGPQPVSIDKQGLEKYFDDELTESICQSNKVCRIDDLFAMGLHCNLKGLKDISVFTVPLIKHGQSLGFILIYHSLQKDLTNDHLNKILAVCSGLSKAIQSCRVFLHSSG